MTVDRKIGVITFHDGINFGAYLQTYALQKIIKDLGFNSYVIDYVNSKNRQSELRSIFRTKNPILFIRTVIKYLKFKKAQREFDKTSLDFFCVNATKNDSLVYGADEIWNYNNPLFGIDLVFFGDTHCDKYIKKISFAPSFGATDITLTPLPNKIINLIESFSSISVRDLNSKEILRKIGLESTLVIDPALIYSFEEELEESSKVGFHLRKYLLIYSYKISDIQKIQIKDYASRKNLKIVSIGYYNKFADENVIGINPFEFIQYFNNASFIITSMFHGVIFSLNFKKKFDRMKYDIKQV